MLWISVGRKVMQVLYCGGTWDYSFIWTLPHISFAPWHNSVSVLAELPLRTATRSLVVCVCVVNLMIVRHPASRPLCGTSPLREATAMHEIIGRAQISHDDGKELCVAQLQDQQSAGRTTSPRAHSLWKCLFLFHSGSRGSRLWRESHVCTETSWHLASTTRENKTRV